MAGSIIDRLSDPTLVAACVDADAVPHSFMSPAMLVPDNWMALIERADGRRRFVPGGEEPRPERDEIVLFVRKGQTAVPLFMEGAAVDKHDVSVSGELLVRWEARNDELASLRRTLLDSGELTVAQLADRIIAGGAGNAVQRFVRESPAARLVHEDLREELLGALREGLKRFLFTTGMTLEGIQALRFESFSLNRKEMLERETAARLAGIESRALVEQAALTATERRLSHLTELLEKMKAAAGAGEGLQWRDLLPSLSPAERGRLLENLWRISPDRQVAAALVAVTGNDCLWFDPDRIEQPLRTLHLDDSLGGLRSVTYSPQRDLLLVGAARGVWIVSAADGTITSSYTVTADEQPRTGFNTAAVAGDWLYASHSQLGVWAWPLGKPDAGEARYRPIAGTPRTVRAALPAGDRVLFAADNVVHMLALHGEDHELSPPAPASIQCLALDGRTVYAGTTSGELVSMNIDRPDGWTPLHRTVSGLESIILRRWTDLLEMVIPAGSAGVHGIYPQQGIVARLMETAVPVRRVWASDDLLVALSENRDRLLVMAEDAADRNGREIPIGRMVGHSVQDAAIVTAGDSDKV
jgi:hypothetical protein